jgi:hypothetical protein
MNNEETNTKRKRGRPRKERNLILYRYGNRIKAWNPVIGANVNITSKETTGNVAIFDGLGFDWVNWGRNQTRDGYYNAATRTPFRQPIGDIDPTAMDTLEEDYKNNAKVRAVMDACSALFGGHRPDAPVILEGAFWMRVLADIFIREAGMDGISRTRFERPEGKVWSSVNVLPVHGKRHNYTEGAFYAIVNMVHPPVFCIKIAGSEYETAPWGASEKWQPHELAGVILKGLWAHKGVNSCEAPVSKAETVAEEPEVLPRCKTCGRVLTFDLSAGVCFECEQQAKAETVANAEPSTRRCRVCNGILQGVFADSVCTKCAATVNVEGGLQK